MTSQQEQDFKNDSKRSIETACSLSELISPNVREPLIANISRSICKLAHALTNQIEILKFKQSKTIECSPKNSIKPGKEQQIIESFNLDYRFDATKL